MLSLWTALFDRGVVRLGAGASAWRQAPWGCCPLALSLPSHGAGGRLGRQAHRHVALGQHHPKPAAQHHLVLGLLALSAAQAPHGAWAAYTFSVITSIGIKNIIISFLIILFLV